MSAYEMQGSQGPAAPGYTPDEMRTGERTGAARMRPGTSTRAPHVYISECPHYEGAYREAAAG
jgi:hypothetical protein